MTLTQLTAGPAFGAEGSRRTASVVMLAMMLGWFGVNAGVAGVASPVWWASRTCSA